MWRGLLASKKTWRSSVATATLSKSVSISCDSMQRRFQRDQVILLGLMIILLLDVTALPDDVEEKRQEI